MVPQQPPGHASPTGTGRAAAPPPDDAGRAEAAARPPSDDARRAYATEIVRALFAAADGGTSRPVGDVVADFPCSHGRQSGRMYVSTAGLFFYSNLFGYEKKMRLDYDDVEGVARVRTTSLEVRIRGGEARVFRSFEDRGRVLGIVARHRPGVVDPSDGAPSAEQAANPVPRAASREEAAGSHPAGREISTVPDVGENPRRVDSRDVPADETDGAEAAFDQRGADENAGEPHRAPMEKDVPSHDEAPREPSCPANDTEESKDDAAEFERTVESTKGWEAAVSNLALPCRSVGAFFDAFLADNAPHSLKAFHGEGGTNVVVEDWRPTKMEGGANVTNSLVRAVSFNHSSGAEVTRRQAYRAFGPRKACLNNETTVRGRGVPDAFHVEDVWFIASDSGEGVTLNIKFNVNFTKKTMLKSVIERRSRAETKEGYRRYSIFARRRTRPDGAAAPEEDVAPADAVARKGGRRKRLLDSAGAWLSLAGELAEGLGISWPRRTQQKLPVAGWHRDVGSYVWSYAEVATNWHRFFVSSIKRRAPSPSAVSIAFLFIAVAAGIIYRLVLRIAALEEVVGDLARRLVELERSHLDMNSIIVVPPSPAEPA